MRLLVRCTILTLAFHQLSGFLNLSPAFECSSWSRRRRSNTIDFDTIRPRNLPRRPEVASSTTLFSGYGVASNYTWKEDAFEIEISVKVPKQIRAKNIFFKATPTSIDLRYREEEEDEHVLLDKNQKLKGRINLDGTYWVIVDPEDQPADHRYVTVTMEKHIPAKRDDFEPIEYDWKAIYQIEDPTITECKYDEPEPLDVREYAASIGVDIDNLDMSKVDKDMFSSGINMTQSTLEQMQKAGYLSEDTITRQADGTEYTTNEDGDPVPYSLEENVAGSDPILEYEDSNNDNNKTVVHRQIRNMTRAAFAVDSAKTEGKADPTKDPIAELTVERLKDILRSQGLPVSGNKATLQERLRTQVNSLMQGKQTDP